MPTTILTKLFKRDNSPKGMITYRLHRDRPVIDRLEHAADWLRLEYIGELLMITRMYGLRGLIVGIRRGRRYGFDIRQGLIDDFKPMPGLLVARLIGLRGLRLILIGFIDGRLAGKRTNDRIWWLTDHIEKLLDIDQDPPEPPSDDEDHPLDPPAPESGKEAAARMFASLMGLPDDPDALELARRLQNFNKSDIQISISIDESEAA